MEKMIWNGLTAFGRVRIFQLSNNEQRIQKPNCQMAPFGKVALH